MRTGQTIDTLSSISRMKYRAMAKPPFQWPSMTSNFKLPEHGKAVLLIARTPCDSRGHGDLHLLKPAASADAFKRAGC